MATVKRIPITVVSDNICPFCYIGKRHLDRAIEVFRARGSPEEEADIQVDWRPFMLDPSLPAEGVNKRERLEKKFGSEAQMERMVQHVNEMGARAGITFSYGGVIGNTLDSHRLVEWAGQRGKQEELLESIFRCYFEEEQNLGDHAVLADAAQEAGLDRDEALEFLASDALREEIASEAARYAQSGISGVPYFTIGSTSVSGAQPPEVLARVLQSAWEEANKQ